MSHPSRPEPDLGVFEALAYLTEYVVFGHEDVGECHFGVAADHG